MIKNDDESDQLSAGAKQVLEACSQIVDCLVDRLLTIEEKVVGEYYRHKHWTGIKQMKGNVVGERTEINIYKHNISEKKCI